MSRFVEMTCPPNGPEANMVTKSYKSAEESFLDRTVRRGDCLIWTGFKVKDGYGTMSVNDRTTRVHRYAWERENGPIPPGMEIDHICHVRDCAEITHLRLATRSENARNRSRANSMNVLGVRNVRKVDNKYWAELHIRGQKWFSSHDRLEDAAAMAEAKRAEFYGAFAGNG